MANNLVKQSNLVIDKKLKIFKYYQNKAIDFSKRNRLLKYPNSASSVEFDISLSECQEFFGSIAELKIELPHKEILKQDLDNQELELFNEEEETIFPLPKTNITGKKLLTQFDKLRLQAKNNFDSHGLHTLFLAVGEIKWKEELAGRGSSEAIQEYDYSAPLLLIPVQITNQKIPQKRSVIEINDELYDVQVNPVLKLFITQELELRDPIVPDDFSTFSWEETLKLLKEFEKIFKEKNIECETTTKIRLGQFTFHGQQIYEDLKRNEKEIIEHEFLSSLCGDNQIIQSDESLQSDDENEVDSFLTEDEDFTILDADESQLRCIRSVIKGKHLVIHGPPGTGKSQTIANLITNLLARNKKVLFVCEKQVALDVVFKRLKTKGADVSDLCLPLFQYTTDKKLFAKSIIDSRNRVINVERSLRSGYYINEKLAERKEKMDSLKEYADALLSVWEPLNKSIYWMHGEIARVLPKIEGIVFPWKDKKTDEIDFLSYQKINQILNDLSEYKDLIFEKENIWQNLKQTSFSPDYNSRLFRKLEELKKIIESFPRLEGSIFCDPKNIKEVLNILNFTRDNDIKELLNNKMIISNIFDSISLQKEIDFSEKINLILNKYDEISGVNSKYKIPIEWELIEVKYSFISSKIDIKYLISLKKEISFIKDKIELFESLMNDSSSPKEISSLNGELIFKYKDLFDIDPIIQKIKGWNEKLSLYEIKDILKNIKHIHDQLNNSQEILNEWAISIDDIDSKLIWEIEQRFSSKYKSFFRNFYSTYKDDEKLITNWCSAHRPQNYHDYKKIIFAASDRLRLQVKFEKMTLDFVEKYASDDSIKNTPIDYIEENILKILNYLESLDIDRLNTEMITLVSASDSFNNTKQIIALYKELMNKKDFLNNITDGNILNENISISGFIKNINEILREFNSIILIIQKSNEFRLEEFSNLETLCCDIKILNELRVCCDELSGLNTKKYFGIENYSDLIGKQYEVDLHKKQIVSVLQVIGENIFSKKDFYKNLSDIEKETENWNNWYLKYGEIKCNMELLMNNSVAIENFEITKMSDLPNHINKMIVDSDGLEKWIKLQRIKSQLNEYGMGWFISEICECSIKEFNFSDIFTWSFINKSLSDIYENDKVLKNFNMMDYVRNINDFKKLENEIFETNQYRVLSKVSPEIKFAKDHGGDSEKVLIRESQKIKRHIPIRKLVMENAAHILNYKPCWMMSPLTLSSYIPFGSAEFDVVIFDEASQMKIENAIGAISRASQVIVIGDEHQLPPTSFFDLSSDDDEEDEEMEEVGYESILQAAITILPGAQAELLYHYRSTSDDLIAFSNHYIYDDRLITFPSPKYKNDAVQFEYVENGIFDGGKNGTKRNTIEAKRVAEKCIEHFKLNSTSLGVIAFSRSQEDAIREAINEKIKEFPELADKFDETSDKRDHFFIKNLETVQGDERDVIILSVGYGPDQNKNVFNRFGPINRKGGYRRLNVAVTRAKDKIICVSSMKFYQMHPSDTSRGAVLLQKYLEYAENGREVLEASKIIRKGEVEADSDFEISVQNALENIGYIIHRQVGASGFSIDLAVVNPENQNEYILGIECDGAAYHSSKSARIRDRLRQQILEKLGWNFYRVWSQHWISHKQEILDDIVSIINKKQ